MGHECGHGLAEIKVLAGVAISSEARSPILIQAVGRIQVWGVCVCVRLTGWKSLFCCWPTPRGYSQLQYVLRF